MTSMVERARGLWGRKRPTSEPIPFSTRCLCGETIQGCRRTDYQVLTCPHCSNSVFVLARNPLPTPEGVRKAQKSEQKTKTAPETKEPRRPTVRTSRPAKQRPPREPIGPKLAAAAKKLVPPKHWFTTPRMIFAGVVFLVVVTAYWQTRARHLRHLRDELVPQARRGMQALADGDLADAYDHLGFAVNAMNVLREPVPDEPIYRQAFAEAEAVALLLPTTLENALFGGTDSPTYASSSIRGQTVILDVEVERDEDDVWQMHFVQFVDGEIVRFHAEDLKLWDELGLQERTRVLAGMKLAGFENLEPQGWSIRLQPDSGVLITEPRIAQELGLAVDPSVGELLQTQRQMAISNDAEGE